VAQLSGGGKLQENLPLRLLGGGGGSKTRYVGLGGRVSSRLIR
jgi:hypothetical protein